VAALALVTWALVAACGSSSQASQLPSSTPFLSPAGGPPRVTGTIFAGPVCPVEQSPPEPQCVPQAVEGAVVVATNASGEEIGRTTSAADGSYLLVVGETGTVLITALPVVGLLGAPAPVSLRLDSPSEVQHLDLEYDTGIR
jgi:hypothetical protein